MAEWYILQIGCPACVFEGRDAGPPSKWRHADCGGIMEVSDEAKLRCKKCGMESHIQNWRWGCPKHGSLDREDYFRKTNSTALASHVSVAAAMTSRTGQKWLMRFLKNLGEW